MVELYCEAIPVAIPYWKVGEDAPVWVDNAFETGQLERVGDGWEPKISADILVKSLIDDDDAWMLTTGDYVLKIVIDEKEDYNYLIALNEERFHQYFKEIKQEK